MNKPTFAEGGFAEIRRVDVSIYYIYGLAYSMKPGGNLIKRTLLIKTDKQKESHIQHELKILYVINSIKMQVGTI